MTTIPEISPFLVVTKIHPITLSIVMTSLIIAVFLILVLMPDGGTSSLQRMLVVFIVLRMSGESTSDFQHRGDRMMVVVVILLRAEKEIKRTAR